MHITLLANAKINLLLDVTGRRADGCHAVEMLMQSIGLCDTVRIASRAETGIVLTCDDPAIPADQRNIAWKAAEIFFSAVPRLDQGISIAIEKRIPAAAGLAGGSADGAAVLFGLRALFSPEMGDDRLAALALRAGADVPFCLRGGLCFAEGVGERLTPLTCLPERYALVLAKPAMGIATGPAYARIDALEHPRHPATRQALRCVRQEDWEGLFPLCGNLFEQAVPPEIAPTLEAIRAAMLVHGAALARMTGSGPTMFAVFREAARAQACAQALRGMEGAPGVFCCRAQERGIATM